jgi:hypothetical protein
VGRSRLKFGSEIRSCEVTAKDARKRGAGHHSAKLTAAKVHTIRQALARGVAPGNDRADVWGLAGRQFVKSGTG